MCRRNRVAFFHFLLVASVEKAVKVLSFPFSPYFIPCFFPVCANIKKNITLGLSGIQKSCPGYFSLKFFVTFHCKHIVLS